VAGDDGSLMMARPRHSALPAGRKLPAVTRNRNYPKPAKHLKPLALREDLPVPGYVIYSVADLPDLMR
jgi:hypothetical protein